MGGKHRIKVYVRIRPLTDPLKPSAIRLTSENAVVVQDTPFSFPVRIVTGSDQALAFDALASDLVTKLDAGFSCTLMAYGQTGSGKTYTMFGPTGCLTEAELAQVGPSGAAPSRWGIFPRVALHLLAQQDCTLHASAVEIYQERVYDLLNHSRMLSVGCRASEDLVVVRGVSGLPSALTKGLLKAKGSANKG